MATATGKSYPGPFQVDLEDVGDENSTAQRTGDKALLAAFQRTIEYNGQIAEKAARTRRKNEEARRGARAKDGGNG